MAKKPTSKTPTVSPAKSGAVDVAKPQMSAQGAAAGTSSAPVTPKKKTSPAKFIQEVRQEARKITWTSRKETWITTVMVLIMVIVAAAFFFVVDGILGFSVSWLTNIGR